MQNFSETPQDMLQTRRTHRKRFIKNAALKFVSVLKLVICARETENTRKWIRRQIIRYEIATKLYHHGVWYLFKAG